MLPHRTHPLPPRRSNPAWLGLALALAWLGTLTTSSAQTQEAASSPSPSATTDAAAKPIFEEWVLIIMDGKTCGFGSTITTKVDTVAGPQYHTASQEEFTVKRIGISMKITENSEVTEDADGGVLSFKDATSGAGSDVESEGTRDGEELVVSSRGQTARYKIPRLAALGPEAIRRQTNAIPLKPGQIFSLNTFSTDYPQGVVVESGKVVGQETRDVRGVSRKLWKQTSEASVMPGLISTSWVDDQSQDVEELVVIPGIGDLHEYVTTREECLKQPEGMEVFTGSLIHPQIAIPTPKRDAQAVYQITAVDLSAKLRLWDQGEQRVLSSEPGTAQVEVTAPTTTPADVTWELPHADTPELHPYLQASSYLEVNSPEIQSLARQAVGDEKNPVRAAHLIQEFVRAYITKKDLNIGFASAQETAKSREGDCTEHSVLCAALGRAVGLPTRCVVGLGYLPPGVEARALSNTVDRDTGIFAFHMWAEAWVGPDKWVPMDAALDGFDVGHIAISKTALEEVNPTVELNAPILQMMSNLKIEVLKIVPKSAMPTAPIPTPSIASPDRSTTLRKPVAPSEPTRAPSNSQSGVD